MKLVYPIIILSLLIIIFISGCIQESGDNLISDYCAPKWECVDTTCSGDLSSGFCDWFKHVGGCERYCMEQRMAEGWKEEGKNCCCNVNLVKC
jgi:hypothetical protein